MSSGSPAWKCTGTLELSTARRAPALELDNLKSTVNLSVLHQRVADEAERHDDCGTPFARIEPSHAGRRQGLRCSWLRRRSPHSTSGRTSPRTRPVAGLSLKLPQNFGTKS